MRAQKIRTLIKRDFENAYAQGVDAILTPATPSAADWANVVTVRVTLLARSATPSAQIDDSNKTYDLNGDNVYDFRCQDMLAAEPYSCQFRRKVFTQLFQLRNIAQRRGM